MNRMRGWSNHWFERVRAYAWLAGGILTASVALALPAQIQAQGTIAGQVVEAGSGEPLVGATVLVRGVERGVITGRDGRFVISDVPAGLREVEARSLGYRATTYEAAVADDGATELTFVLEIRPVQLSGIQVSVLRPDLQPQAQLAEREVREANPKDSGQLLRQIDGVDAVRRGAVGLDPVVRGLRETEVGTYVDGSRYFPAGPGRMDSGLTHLDPSAVREIEVVKGPYALTWGAGNLSAIRVETAPLPSRGDEVPHGFFGAGYDSNLEAQEVAGGVSGRSGSVAYSASGAWREGGDYDAGGSEAPSIAVPADFSSYEARGKVGFDVGRSSSLTLSGGYQDQGRTDYPGRLMTALFFYSSNLSARWETERNDGLLRNLELLAYRNDVSHGMDNREKPSAAMNDVSVDSGIEVLGGRAAADLVTGPWSIRVGGDIYSARRDAVRIIRPLMGPMVGTESTLVIWPDATTTDLGVFGRVARTLDSGARLAGTLRLDQVWSDAANPSASFLDFLSRVDGSQDLAKTETNVSAAVTAGFDLGSRWGLSLGLGSAVRTADATERYSDHQPASKSQFAAEFMGNPSLEPERSTQADVWLEGRYSRATVSLNVFGRQVADYITLALTEEEKQQQMPIFPPTVYRYVNGEATFYGGDASVAYALSDVLTAEAGGAYLWGEETSFPTTDASVEVTEPALGVAPLKGRLGLRYEELGGRWYVEGAGTLVSEQTRVAATRGEIASDGYALLDLRGGFAPMRGVNVGLGVENVFDERYSNHLNSKNPFTGDPVLEPGRVFYVDVSSGF